MGQEHKCIVRSTGTWILGAQVHSNKHRCMDQEHKCILRSPSAKSVAQVHGTGAGAYSESQVHSQEYRCLVRITGA